MIITLHLWNFRKTWKLEEAEIKKNYNCMDESGLTVQEIADIKAIFSNYPQIEEVLIYGSRAIGNYKPASDIDLSLKGKGIDLSLQTKIEFDLDDLMLPYKFDISIYDKIANPEFLDHINRVGRQVYRRKHNENTALRRHNAG